MLTFEEPVHISKESQQAPPGPSPTRTKSFFASDMPRGPSARGDEPRMVDFFTKLRELLYILKSLHSTG